MFYVEIVPGKRRRVDVSLLIAPQLSANVSEFTLVDERVAYLRLWVGERVLTVVCVYMPNSGSVLDIQIKRGTELSTDHHLVVNWIRWWERMPDRPAMPKGILRLCWARVAEDPV